MERIAEGVYEVKKGFRAFVIDGDEGLTLIDTGLPKRSDAFRSGIESIGRSVSDIRSIVLTHNHTDHAGSAARLKQDSGARLYCSPADSPAVRGHSKAPTPPFVDRTPLQILKPLLKLLPTPEPADVDHEIGPGHVLSLPEDLTAIATPGHTAGHTSLHLDRAGGILFVGDAAANKGGKISRGWFNRKTPEIDASLKALAGHDFKIACFGHSPAILGGAAEAFKAFAVGL